MAFLAIVVLGAVSYLQLPVQLIPDFTFPVIAVRANWDRSPTEIQEELTKPIEGILAEMSGVRSMNSRTWSGGVRLRAEFDYDTDVQYTLVDLQERLNSFQNSFSDRRLSVSAFAYSTVDWQRRYMRLEVRGKGDEQTLYDTAMEKVEQRLASLDGVANVEVYGNTNRSAEIQIEPDLLSAYNLDFGQVINRVQAAVSDDTFLGTIKAPTETFYVRLDDQITTLEELAEIYVDNEGIVRLKDVSRVGLGETVDRWIYRTEGKNSINISLERESDRNLIDLARETRERVEEINQDLPPGIELVIDRDTAEPVEKAINKLKTLALIGGCLALLVPLIFFQSLRVAMIVFISVPISLISVFNLFYAAEMSINIFSIVGLAMGVGMLVDNSIVVVENSFRLFHRGKSARDAAMLGGSDVGRGLLAATLTTVVVFVPILFVEGRFKLIVKEPTLALVFPLIISLLVALTLVPVFTVLVLKTKKRHEKMNRIGNFFVRGYRKLLKSALRYRGRVLLIIAIALSFTILDSCQRLSSATTSDRAEDDYFEFYFEAPQGSTLADVNRAVQPIEERLAEHPDIETYSVAFDEEDGEARIRLKERSEREEKRSYQEIRQTILDFMGPVPGLALSLERPDDDLDDVSLDLGPRGELELKGLDLETIQAHAERLATALRAHPQITNVEFDEEMNELRYLARVDRERSRIFNITGQSIGRFVGATRSGGTVSSLQLENGDERTDVLFTIEGSEGSTLDEVKRMEISAPGGGSVPLGELVQMQVDRADRYIYRRDRQESADLDYFYVQGTDKGKLVEDIRKIVGAVPNPGGVITEFTGDERRLRRRNEEFKFIVWWGVILVYVVMAAVFESFWVPFTILATNPLMIMGIVWGLNFAGLPMDDLAAFGIILLVGLAVNNGIVMMDRALHYQRDGGYNRTRAIFEAAVTRLRPIIMTYFTTVLGLLPLALVGDADDQWRPVAVVVIGGLTSATVLMLIVLPCFYLIGDDFVRWIRPSALRLLQVAFEIPEAIANLLFHPIRVYRRELPFAPNARRLFWSMATFVFEFLRTPVKLVVSLPADLLFLLTRPWRKRAPADEEKQRGFLARAGAVVAAPFRWCWRTVVFVVGVPWTVARWATRPLATRLAARLKRPAPEPAFGEAAPVNEETSPPVVSLTNIHVIYPPGGLKGLQSYLPGRWGGVPGLAALDGISLEMERGLFGLLGPNGAGKTTLLRSLAGLHEPTRGTVRLFGVSHREARGQLAPLIGYLPQTHGHYDEMTLYDYLDYFGMLTAQNLRAAQALSGEGSRLGSELRGLAELETPAQRHRAIHRAAEEVNLSEFLQQKLGTFSGGMKQRAGIARVLLQAPPILIIDEPTAGLDPMERIRVRMLLANLAADRLVIVSTHIVEDLEENCDRLAILNRGRLAYLGSPEGLKESWDGRIWEILFDEGKKEELVQRGLPSENVRVLSQVVERGLSGYRVLSTAPPGPNSREVKPTLEDALLAILGESAGSS